MMDTSMDYIRQCEKAVEVQEYGAEHLKQLRPLYCWDDILQRVSMYLWMPTTLSHKLNMDTDEIIISIEEDNEANIWYDPQKGSIVWLPRQDQLQEMVDEESLAWLISEFESFATDWHYFPGKTTAFVFESMEQLWLAFVMKEKFGKVWDGKDWRDDGTL